MYTLGVVVVVVVVRRPQRKENKIGNKKKVLPVSIEIVPFFSFLRCFCSLIVIIIFFIMLQLCTSSPILVVLI